MNSLLSWINNLFKTRIVFSQIGPVTRASKVDFDELASSLHRMETECKASFDYLKLIIKHDGSATSVKVK